MNDFEDENDNRIYNFLSKILKFIRKLELEDLVFISFSAYVIILASWHIGIYINDYVLVILDISIIIFSIYVNIYYFLTKIERNDSKFISTLIKKNFLIKKGRKKYINWEAFSSIGTFTAILMTSITGLISIKLSSKALEISRNMKDISEEMKDYTQETTRIQMTSSLSDVFLKGNIIFGEEDIKESETVLKNFHSYFCSIMNVPDDVLSQIVNINFREAYNDEYYFKAMYGFDDNLIYIIKFYFQKYQYILKYSKYFNIRQILKEYIRKMDMYGRILKVMCDDEKVIAISLSTYVPEEIICILSKLNYLKPYVYEQYFSEVYKDKHEAVHQNEIIFFQSRLKDLEKMRIENDPEYILFKNMMDYRTRHQNPVRDDTM